MLLILLLVVLILAAGGWGFYEASGPAGWSPLGIVLLVVIVLLVTGNLHI